MGCDIHLAVEVRKNGRWSRRLPLPEAQNEWLVKQAERTLSDRYANLARVTWYDTRCYDAFAILANVRNGFGFAGIPTGEGFIPIAHPKGMPLDVSKEVYALYDQSGLYDGYDIWLGDHSHSWLTLEELDSYDWTQTTRKRGIVSLKEFAAMQAEGRARPTEYSGGVFGQKIVTVSEETARAQLESLNGLVAPVDVTVYVDVSWSVTYAEAAGELYSKLIPNLRILRDTESVSSSDVRIVFGFDS